MLMNFNLPDIPASCSEYSTYEWLRQCGQLSRQMSRASSSALLGSSSKAFRLAGGVFDTYGRARFTHTDPGFNITEITRKRRSLGIAEKVVCPDTFGDLIHFSKDGGGNEPRVLIVPPMSGHFPSLVRGTVLALLNNNDVYVVNWKNPRDISIYKGDFGISEYIQYIMTFIRKVGRGVHVIAVCQPCPLVLSAVALMSEAGETELPGSMTLIAGPVDTRVSPTAPCEFAQRHSLNWFKDNLSYVPLPFGGMGRLVLPGFRQVGGFMAMNLETHTRKHQEQFENLVSGEGGLSEKHASFYRDFRAVSDLPSKFFLETIDAIFLRHLLPKGELRWYDQAVNLGAVTKVPTLVIEGANDDITGRGQTKAALDLLTGLDLSKVALHIASGVGHYGTFTGSRFNQSIAPCIEKFIRSHDHG